MTHEDEKHSDGPDGSSAWLDGPWDLEKVETSCGYCYRIGPFHACLYVDRRGGVANSHLSDEDALAIARLIADAPRMRARLDVIGRESI